MPLRMNSAMNPAKKQAQRPVHGRDKDDGGCDRHDGEVADGDPGTAEAIREPATGRPAQRAEQRAEERQAGHLDWGSEVSLELHLQHLAKGEAKADERSECPDVKHGHDPRVHVAAGVQDGVPGLPAGRQVVHAQGRTNGREDDQWNVDTHDNARMLLTGGGQDRESGQLHYGDPEVSATGVDPERPALALLRIERVDVCHRRGKVATPETRDGGDHYQRRIRDSWVEDNGG